MSRLSARLGGGKIRRIIALATLLLGSSLWMSPPASAFVLVQASPSFPDTVVGQQFAAALGIANNTTPPESTFFPVMTVSDIDLYPSCTTPNTDCLGGTAEPGVYALAPTGVGTSTTNPGNVTCVGQWTIVPNTGDPATATSYRFIPPLGEGTLALATGETCIITFEGTTLRVPTNDVQPAIPGVQTWHTTGITPGAVGQPPFGRTGQAEFSTVAQGPTGLTTVAAQSSASIPGTTTDTATLAPVAPNTGAGTLPTGTITFTLFGPNDPGCVGPPIAAEVVPVNGFGDYFTGPVPITAPGTYQWVASYSGDANYLPSTTACGDPLETVTFAPAVSEIVTQATPTATIGQPITDTATVTGFNPTGTVNFSVFGPNDPTCAGAPIFVSNNRPLSAPVGPPPNSATATSDPFTPVVPGEYRWIASYSGDANNAPATSPCNAPNELTVVEQATVNIVTVATPAATIGSPISDTATITPSAPNLPAPTGTVTFTVFGPNDAVCAGPPVFTSAPQPVSGGPPFTAASGPFTPAAPGEYRWIATYSGDANYAPAATLCNDPNETSVIQQATVDIVTQASTSGNVGSPISDTATLTPSSPSAPPPTGTVTFTAFGPNDPDCTGAPAFNSGPQPVSGGPPFTATSGPFTPTAPGTYRWIATYSGDVNYAAATTPCNAPGEITPVERAEPVIVTQAFGPVTLTQPIRDTATLTAGQAPTGTITFTLFGPDNPTCAGAPIFTSTVPVAGNGAYTSGDFTPTAPGTYQWVAVYSGDANNAPATSPCGAPNEQSVVTVLPTIVVEKTADPLSRPEPGGDFTYTVVVTNTSTENLTITSLNDSVYGDLATRPGSTCGALIGTTLAPGASSPPCTFTAPFTGAPGDTLTNVVTVTGRNPGGVEVTDTDDAVVTITPLAPVIQVVKTADPLTRPEPGGDFDFTVTVTNPADAPETVTITGLTDDVYGDLSTRGTCTTAVGTVLDPGESYTCTFTGPFTGPPGATQTDVVTVNVVDDDGQTATDTDDATVAITNVVPQILVEKDATPPSRPEPGGDFTFDVRVINNSNETLTITSLTDDVYGNLATRGTCTTAIGTVLAPAGGTYTCSFTAPFTGNAGQSQTDVVTVTGVDDEGTTVTDTDDATVTLTGVPPTVLVDKTANPLSRPEPGGTFTFTVVVTNTSNEPVTITTLTDDVYGNLATRGTCTTAIGTVLAAAPGPGNTYTCNFTATVLGDAGDSQRDVVTVVVRDDDNQTATDTDDAIVTITNVPPTVLVDKTANPLSRPEPGGSFRFTVVVTNTSFEPVTITSLVDDVHGNLNGRGTCATGAVLAAAPGPGNTYTCTFEGTFLGDAGARQTDVVTVVVVDNDNQTATDNDDAIVTITDVLPTIAVTKTATPASLVAPGGDFTFTVGVTNTSNEPVTITSLVDDVYGDLNGRGTCAVGAVLQPGDTYTCSFTGEFRGSGGASQIDTVTATAVDNEGNPAVAQAQAQVRLEAPPAPPPPPTPQQPRIAFTGGGIEQSTRVASAFVMVGLLLVATTWRSRGGLAFAGMGTAFSGTGTRTGTGTGGRWTFHGPDDGPEPPLTGPIAFRGGPPGGGPGGRPGSTALMPPVPGLDELTSVWAPVRPASTPPSANRLASGLGLAAGGRPATKHPTATSPASRAALNMLGMRTNRKP